MKIFSVLFNLSFLLWAGCNLLSNEGQGEQQARIIFGKSIDGVEISDDTTTVIRKLGEPSGFAYPDYAGEIYLYVEDNFVFIEILISYILPHGVMNLSISYPYSGKTVDGVGIGTPRSDALNALGPPDVSDMLSNVLIDSYFFEDNTFRVEYHENNFFSIWMVR